MKQSCKTCKWIVIPPNEKRIMSYRMYVCSFPLPEKLMLPDTITKAFGFNYKSDQIKHTCPVYGETCATYERAKK